MWNIQRERSHGRPTEDLPSLAACDRTLVAREWAAPASRRTEATSTCPSLAEMCSGVYPFVVAASGWAMCCRSSWTISVLPRREAICKGVCSSYNSSQVKSQCQDTPNFTHNASHPNVSWCLLRIFRNLYPKGNYFNSDHNWYFVTEWPVWS